MKAWIRGSMLGVAFWAGAQAEEPNLLNNADFAKGIRSLRRARDTGRLALRPSAAAARVRAPPSGRGNGGRA
jgi:hypothetical protein